MASNAEMRRLILHAADRLTDEDPGRPYHRMLAAVTMTTGEQSDWVMHLWSVATAMALAEQTLRLVAACLADDEPDQAALEADHG